MPQAKFCGECGTSLGGKAKVKRQKSKSKSSSSKPKHRTPNTQPPSSYTPRHLAERIRAEREAMEARGHRMANAKLSRHCLPISKVQPL